MYAIYILYIYVYTADFLIIIAFCFHPENIDGVTIL